MPGFILPRATADSENDPYGISQVSGFYGPGAWASWIIALTSSWISLLGRRGDQELSYDLIAHLLYFNWAAVDLLRQVIRAHGTIASLAAAVGVSYWGLLQNFMQFMLIGTCGVKRIRREGKVLLVLCIGLVLPSAALMSFLGTFCIGERTLGMYVFDATYVDTKVADEVLSNFSTAMSIIGILFLVVCATKLGDEWAKEGWKGFADTDISEVLFVTSAVVFLGIFFCVSFFLLCLVPSARNLKGFELRPCTAQQISDWDQAFALLCALVFFVRGTGMDIYRLMRLHR